MYGSRGSTRPLAPGSPRREIDGGDRLDPLRRWAFASLIAGLTAAGLRAAFAFDHGIWLVAYLLLVGFLAPFALSTGRAVLLDGRASRDRIDAQALFWGFGTIAVPVGVFADSRLAVVLGGVALLIALRWAAAPAIDAHGRSRRPALAYAQLGLVAFMAVSVVVGIVLAWDIPWY
jgi:hypothetical protein